MSAAKRRGRWQGGDAADSTEVRQGGDAEDSTQVRQGGDAEDGTEVRQGVPNAASGILIELLNI